MRWRYTATFPSANLRAEFLEQVNLWNCLEDLPRIEAEPMPNGRDIRIRGVDWQVHGVRRLVDAYGGRIDPSGTLAAAPAGA